MGKSLLKCSGGILIELPLGEAFGLVKRTRVPFYKLFRVLHVTFVGCLDSAAWVLTECYCNDRIFKEGDI